MKCRAYLYFKGMSHLSPLEEQCWVIARHLRDRECESKRAFIFSFDDDDDDEEQERFWVKQHWQLATLTLTACSKATLTLKRGTELHARPCSSSSLLNDNPDSQLISRTLYSERIKCLVTIFMTSVFRPFIWKFELIVWHSSSVCQFVHLNVAWYARCSLAYSLKKLKLNFV